MVSLVVLVSFLALNQKKVDAIVGVVINSPTNNATISDNRPVISGTGMPNTYTTIIIQEAVPYTPYTVYTDSSGKWTVATTNVLLDGTYHITASQAGIGSVSSTFNISTPLLPPVVNIQSNSSTNILYTNSQRPTIYGTSNAPYQTIKIVLDGADLPNLVNTDGYGNWNYTPTTNLSVGDHTIAAKTVNGSVTSAASSPIKVTIDITPPAAPIIDSSLNNLITNNQKPIINGTAEANSRITVNIDGIDYADVATALNSTGTAGANEKWSYTPTVALGNGNHVITAKAKDLANNLSTASTVTNITIDTIQPAVPIIKAPINNLVTSNKTQIISGTSEANAKITVKIDGVELPDIAKADAYGVWSFTPTLVFSEGTHSIAVKTKDIANNVSNYSNPTIFVVDTIPPDPVVITRPAGDITTNNQQPIIIGTAEPNTSITLTIDGKDLASPIAVDAVGDWKYLTPQNFSDGVHKIVVKAKDAANNVSKESTININVDSIKPDAPVILGPLNGSTNLPKITINGTAEPNSTIIITIDGKVLPNTVVADVKGYFKYITSLSKGFHRISITARDSANNESDDATNSIKVVSVLPIIKPAIKTPKNGAFINDSKFSINGTSEANAKIIITIDGKDVTDSVFSDATGNWTYSPSVGLGEGKHKIRIKAVNTVYDVINISGEISVIVDTIAPQIPTINTPQTNKTISAKNLLITGLAEPNSIVTVMLDDRKGTTITYKAKASKLGTWGIKSLKQLKPGNYIIAIEATDAANNTSKLSQFINININ